jgi:hypothetical protein
MDLGLHQQPSELTTAITNAIRNLEAAQQQDNREAKVEGVRRVVEKLIDVALPNFVLLEMQNPQEEDDNEPGKAGFGQKLHKIGSHL